MDIIHLLPDSVANQIAAGEVIQRPASCLKELVENSLDAGAKNIEIIIRDAGRTLLQVIDDGTGMSETDARMAFERHATSKISNAADLFALHTMGFRGEALASIAAVAQIEITTRKHDSEMGTLLEIAGSQVIRQEPTQCDVGTNFKVKNLFFNVPARRRFLKTNSTELRNLVNEFHRIVLVNPDVRFTFVNDDEILFDLPVCSLKQRIDDVFGKSLRKSMAAQLVNLKAETSIVSIYGYLGKPEAATKQPQQYFFVNGRYMKHPYFHKAVQAAYSGMLAPDQQPHYFIYFDISPEQIDVNIHPTKTEIKFADEQMIWQVLLAALKESLGKFNVAPSLDFDREGDIDMPSAAGVNARSVDTPRVSINIGYNPFNQVKKQQNINGWEQMYPTDGSYTYYTHKSALSATTQATINDSGISQSEQEINKPLFEIDLSQLTPYQYKEKYIILPSANGLLFINQHRAHAAVLYASFREQIKNRKPTMQQVLFPEVLDLSTDHSELLIQMIDELRNAGFDITQLSRNSFSVNAVPAELGNQNALAVLLDILHIVAQTGGSTKQQWEHRIATALAEASAIPEGRKMQEIEMKDLLERFSALKNTIYSPDGKRICAVMTDDSISKLFN